MKIEQLPQEWNEIKNRPKPKLFDFKYVYFHCGEKILFVIEKADCHNFYGSDKWSFGWSFRQKVVVEYRKLRTKSPKSQIVHTLY